MLYDADIRDSLCLFLESKYGKVRFFDEITMGKSRADLVMITETGIVGVEIKSDADTYARLPRQVKDYDKYFDFNIIACGSSHAKHVNEHVPEYWGIITVDEVDGDVDLYEARIPEPVPKTKAKLKRQLGLLWRRELSHIQKINKLYKYAGKSRGFVENYVLESVDERKLKVDILNELFERDYTLL